MKSRVRQLHEQKLAVGTVGIAEVVTAEGGEALQVILCGQREPLSVAGHFSDVPPLREGDRVALLASAEGPLVIGRLRGSGESPPPLLQDREGRLLIAAGEGICLQAGGSRIELDADGRIRLDGREIASIASGLQRLQGSTIELN
ncbi:hypothetical protein DSOUD_3248 [Desulfuromonas soudanensis]|uniref:Uncharacterized protein n=1 Tax=Desulfuromonas soudanensis TaxID=1603606 RepID=A0A0M5IRY9_9BACT|nr:hypothetical protein [Desulfuromonas soudanensis]ALC17968.1 hypothetical protein DSOUD_3248 [Desulfuromonas soudanensis]